MYDPLVYVKVTGNERKGLKEVNVTIDKKGSVELFIWVQRKCHRRGKEHQVPI
jgi:hypothetical protein